MAIVADSSPLILYAKIGRFDLLRALFGRVLIPPAIRREVVDQGPDRPGAVEVSAAGWISVEQPSESSLAAMPSDLGRGESEAVALALERGLSLVVDDRRGRDAAVARGIPVTGSAGVLLAAKRRRILDTVRPVLDALMTAGLRLDTRLYRQTLEQAGELPDSKA